MNTNVIFKMLATYAVLMVIALFAATKGFSFVYQSIQTTKAGVESSLNHKSNVARYTELTESDWAGCQTDLCLTLRGAKYIHLTEQE